MSNSRDIADSAATINFIDGVTSNVQTQLNTATTAIAANTTAIGNINPSASLEAVASGALANGDTVIINADGTVTAAGLVSTPVPVIGSSVEFEAGTTRYISSAYDTTSNKVIIAYQDSSNSNIVKAVVGTVASGAITFGTPAIISPQSHQGIFTSIAYDANANKVVVVYHKNATNDGLAQVGTISGTSISFGAENLFSSNEIGYNAICYDSSANKLIIAWYESSAIKVTVGTISGTNITFGAVATTAAPSSQPIGLVYDANANKTLLCYRGPSNYGYAAVISVSGTTASIGTPAAFVSETVSDVDAVYDSSNNKTLIVWRKAGNNYGAGIVATISGTSVTFGTEAVIASETGFYFAASFDTTVNKSIVAYYNSSSGYSKSVQGTISGTSVTFSSATTYLTAQTQYNALVYDPDSARTVFAFGDGGNSYKGTSLLYSSTTSATNLTTENYIGISDAAYANGATAKIQLASATDDAQSGLTAGQSYFVQENGSLALTPDTTSVFAGTAVSATKLLIGERNELPYQTGNSGKVLTTNGTLASWATPSATITPLNLTLISGQDFSSTNASQIEFTSLSDVYDYYLLFTHDLNMGSQQNPTVMLSDSNGSSYNSNIGGDTNTRSYGLRNSGAWSGESDSNANRIWTYSNYVTAYTYIWGLRSAEQVYFTTYYYSGRLNSGYYGWQNGRANNGTQNVNALRYQFGATATSGSVYLYGVTI